MTNALMWKAMNLKKDALLASMKMKTKLNVRFVTMMNSMLTCTVHPLDPRVQMMIPTKIILPNVMVPELN
jgi:hypothetical protein